MAYERLRTLSFRLKKTRAKSAKGIELSVLSIPNDWKRRFRSLSSSPSAQVRTPVWTLNAAVRALVPGILTVGSHAADDGSPWLLARETVPPSELFAIVAAWMRHEFSRAEALNDALAAMRPEDFVWGKERVPFDDWSTAENGTASPGKPDRAFSVIPAAIAAELAGISIELGGQPRKLYRVPQDDRNRSEVVSWPPYEHDGRGEKWPYSLFLQFALQTTPFIGEPRINCHAGIRRWAIAGSRGRSIYLPSSGSTTVLLRTRAPWIAETAYPPSFQSAELEWSYGRDGASGPRWSNSLPAILDLLRPGRTLPTPEKLVARPEDSLSGDPIAAITFRNGITPIHQVMAGLSPYDRREIFERVVESSARILAPVEPLERAALRTSKKFAPKVSWKPSAKVKPGASDTLAFVRGRIAAACRGALVVDVLHQTDHFRDGVLRVLAASAGPLREAATGEWTASTAELSLTIRTRPLGSLGDSLERLAAGGRDERNRAALIQRCEQVFRSLPPLQVTGAALVELGAASDFAAGTDPKDALRRGLALSGRVSQFVNTLDVPDEETLDPHEHRLTNAWRDTLRQLGVVTVDLPRNVNALAFWLVTQTRRTAKTGYPQQLPVAIWVTPEGSVRALAPGMKVPLAYRDFLLHVASRESFGYGRRDDVVRFIEEVLRREVTDTSKPTLMLTEAQNLTKAWSFLQNGRLAADSIGFGAVMDRISSFPGLRHVRACVGDGLRTPDCFGEADNAQGVAKGLWKLGGNGRVFASTSSKPVTAKTALVSASKFGPWRGKKGKQASRPNASTWSPTLLELTVAGIQEGDDPTEWAAAAHQLRFVASHFDDALLLPLPLHLARTIEEYLIPIAEEPAARASALK